MVITPPPIELPLLQDSKDDLRKHLDLLSQCEESSDDSVLSIYPVGIKRRVLR